MGGRYYFNFLAVYSHVLPQHFIRLENLNFPRLAATKNIGEGLKKFGISPTTAQFYVVAIDATDQQLSVLRSGISFAGPSKVSFENVSKKWP